MDRFGTNDKSGSGSQGNRRSKNVSGAGLQISTDLQAPTDLSQNLYSDYLSGMSDLEEQDVEPLSEHDQSVSEQSTQELGQESNDCDHSNPAAVKELKSNLQTLESFVVFHKYVKTDKKKMKKGERVVHTGTVACVQPQCKGVKGGKPVTMTFSTQSRSNLKRHYERVHMAKLPQLTAAMDSINKRGGSRSRGSDQVAGSSQVKGQAPATSKQAPATSMKHQLSMEEVVTLKVAPTAAVEGHFLDASTSSSVERKATTATKPLLKSPQRASSKVIPRESQRFIKTGGKAMPPRMKEVSINKIGEVSAAIKELKQLNKTIIGPAEEDECEAFGKYVSIQLKKLPLTQCIEAQDRVHNLLTKHRIAAIGALEAAWGSSLQERNERNANGSDGRENAGEDRKVDITSIGGGNFTSGPSENSTGSGEAQGGCDEVSMPLSPEQFLSEDMDHGTSPTSTPFHQRPESYKLRHNNHLTLVLESLAGDESFMDVTLTAQGKAIKAHKSVLSAVSPYFRRVLKENPCQHPIIIMARDIRFEELNNIVSYVYKGEMTVPADELPSLLKTAENLEVTGLSPSEGSGGAGNIMSQMQGIPSGIFANTPSSNSSSSKSSSKKSSSKQSHPPQAPNYPDEAPPNYPDEAPVSSDDHSRIDPLDFLNTDMTCVKEEITSDNEEADEMSFSSLTADTTQTTTNKSYVEFPKLGDSVHSLSPRNDIGNLQTLASSSRENDDAIDKPFNPGELDDTPGSSPTESFSPHVCPHCMESHRPNDALQAHLRLKHPSKPSFVCACGRVFIRQYLYTEHMKKCDV